jgi:hypothetical protein
LKDEVMDPQPPTQPEVPDLQDLRIDVLRAAADLYMEYAYSGATPPENVRARLAWETESNARDLLSKPPFECAGRNKSTGTGIYALRLGNARYPHMKLQIQPWPNSAGFLLSVNTHDQVLAIDPAGAGMVQFRALQEENQRLKEVIEQAWDDAGLPTFLRYLRSYIEQKSAEARRAADGQG